MKSTTDYAAQIRASLKKLGYSGRDVSVRSDYYSGGSAIRIQVKNPAVSLALVKTIADPAESISRCEITGEILSGGNRYVSVTYTTAALEALTAPHRAAAAAAVASLTDDRTHADIASVPGASVSRYNGHMLSVWGAHGHLGTCWTADDVARLVGVTLANAA